MDEHESGAMAATRGKQRAQDLIKAGAAVSSREVRPMPPSRMDITARGRISGSLRRLWRARACLATSQMAPSTRGETPGERTKVFCNRYKIGNNDLKLQIVHAFVEIQSWKKVDAFRPFHFSTDEKWTPFDHSTFQQRKSGRFLTIPLFSRRKVDAF